MAAFHITFWKIYGPNDDITHLTTYDDHGLYEFNERHDLDRFYD